MTRERGFSPRVEEERESSVETQKEAGVYQRMTDQEAEEKMNERLSDDLEEKIESLIPELNGYGKASDPKRIRLMVEDFKRLLLELEKDLVNYDTIISDDSSGRLPSLVFRKIINRKRKEAGLPEAKTFFVASGRHNFKAIEEDMLDFLKSKKKEAQKVLLVTEYIFTGRSIEELVKLLEKAEIDFDLASISIEFTPKSNNYDGFNFNFLNHLRYGGVNEGGLFFYGHGGSGVIKDEYAGRDTKNIHPIKNLGVLQRTVNRSRKNINLLADALYPLVETK